MGKRKVAAATWEESLHLVPWTDNPRLNDGEPVQAVALSLLRFGWGNPILVRSSDMVVIAGHTRLKALQWLQEYQHSEADGWTPRDPTAGPWLVPGAPGPGYVPCRMLDLSESEAHALALADNKIGELAAWDEDALGKLLAGMREDEVEILDLGWGEDALQELIDGSHAVAAHVRTNPGDETPKLREVFDSVPGKVYQLGPHRVMCGDSTELASWEKLLEGEKLQAVWTDPPYGVGVVGGDTSLSHEERRRRGGLEIANDALSPDELREFLRSAFDALLASCKPGACWYVAAPPGPLNYEFATVLRDLEVWRWTLIWVKNRFCFGRADYHHRHEMVFYGWVPGAAHYFVDDRTQDTVFEFPRPSKSPDHPTMKPISLVVQHVENSSKPGWIVGDPFGGSGTTLMACAQTGRVCRTIELDPRYVDVIRRRYTTWALANDLDPGTGALE